MMNTVIRLNLIASKLFIALLALQASVAIGREFKFGIDAGVQQLGIFNAELVVCPKPQSVSGVHGGALWELPTKDGGAITLAASEGKEFRGWGMFCDPDVS